MFPGLHKLQCITCIAFIIFINLQHNTSMAKAFPVIHNKYITWLWCEGSIFSFPLSPLLQLLQGRRDVEARVHLASATEQASLHTLSACAQQHNLRTGLINAIAAARGAS